MHAYIFFQIDPSNPALPLHYNYFIQSAIYAALPENVASRMHDRGYSAGNRAFKMFSFSRILGRFVINSAAGSIRFPDGARLVISSPDTGFFLSLVNNLLTKKHIQLKNSFLNINEVRFDEQKVTDNVLLVRTLSPVVVYSTLLKPEGGKYTCYYQPGEHEFAELINTNLRKKYEAFYGKEPPKENIRIKPLDRPRQHVTYYKNTVIKGYTCRLKLWGPQELLQIGLDAGLGGKGSQGYGCVEKIK